jgi:hypothetical protein
MSLKDAFNTLEVLKINDNVLRVGNGYFTTVYDFAQRIMYSGNNMVPFSLLDRETLIAARDRLIDLKGTPPELPQETQEMKPPAPRFNL